jgi:preprotein translocase subunit YajC
MFNFLTIAAAEAPASSSNGLISFVPMILIFVVMFYFMFRSQKKQAQKRQQMIDTIVKGAEVIIAGGIHGTIIAVKDKTFIVEIADKINVEVTKAGVNGVISEDVQSSKDSCCK